MAKDEHETDRAAPSVDAKRLGEAAATEIARQLREPLSAGLYLVATPIGNLGDITLRALAALASAHVIYCEDTRHSRTLLSHFGIDRPLRAYHEHNAEAERPRILKLLAEGQRIALISDAGTPLVSDPGYKLVREAVDAGHGVCALPGASAVMAGLTVSALGTDAFLFAGFLPPKEGARRTRLGELKAVPATLIFFEAPSRIAAALADLAHMYPDRQVSLARELTKRFEEVWRGTTHELAARAAQTDVKGEIVLIVEAPKPTVVSDEAITTELQRVLPDMSFRDAVRTITEHFGAPRSRVYELALALKGTGDT